MNITKEQLELARQAAALILPVTAPQAWALLQLAEGVARTSPSFAGALGEAMTKRPGFQGQPREATNATTHRKIGYPMHLRLMRLDLVDAQGELTERGRRVQAKLKARLEESQ